MRDIPDFHLRTDADDFWLLSLTRFCSGLPSVKPLSTQRKLDAAYFSAMKAGNDVAVVDAVAVPVVELAQLHCVNVFGARAISPKGAALLIRLYRQGLLDTGGAQPAEPTANAQRYAASHDTWLAFRKAKGFKFQRERMRANAEYKDRLRDLESWDDSEFTYKVLNDIFWENLKVADGVLQVGGLTVRRGPLRFTDASGNYTLYKHAFSWSDHQGVQRVLVAPSA